MVSIGVETSCVMELVGDIDVYLPNLHGSGLVKQLGKTPISSDSFKCYYRKSFTPFALA